MYCGEKQRFWRQARESAVGTTMPWLLKRSQTSLTPRLRQCWKVQNQIRDYAKTRGLHPRLLARWLAWPDAASEALCRLATTLKIGENHLRDLIDWLEEIALRDRCGIDAILADKAIMEIEVDPRLGRADKLKRIKEEVRRRRFPRLTVTETAVKHCIRQLALAREIRIAVPPGLEGGWLEVAFRASSAEEVKHLADKLLAAADSPAMKEAFALLAGADDAKTDG
jgi:hypothetical protein